MNSDLINQILDCIKNSHKYIFNATNLLRIDNWRAMKCTVCVKALICMQLESDLFLSLGVYNKSIIGKRAYDR